MAAAAAVKRKTIALIFRAAILIAAVRAIALRRLRLLAWGLLRAGDERRQSLDVAARLRLIELLLMAARREMLRLMLRRRLLRERLRIARQEWLRLAGAERGVVAAHHRLSGVVLVALIEALVGGAANLVLRTGEVRVVLAELFLRGGNEAEVMLGVLIIILG